jgi:hypothetical protein
MEWKEKREDMVIYNLGLNSAWKKENKNHLFLLTPPLT